MPKPKGFKGENWKGRKLGAYMWYEIQDAVDYYEEFERPKIIIPCIIQKASYAYDTKKIYSNDKTSIIASDSLYLLGILNSKAADHFIHSISSTKQGGYYEYKPMYVSQLPIPPAPSPDTLTPLVSKMLDLHKKLSEANVPGTKTMLQRQIETTDKQIDRLVYDLYGLTEAEIKIVEGS